MADGNFDVLASSLLDLVNIFLFHNLPCFGLIRSRILCPKLQFLIFLFLKSVTSMPLLSGTAHADTTSVAPFSSSRFAPGVFCVITFHVVFIACFTTSISLLEYPFIIV